MKSFYILLLALSITAVSCRTKEGEPGPAGESALSKQGSISGTLNYVDVDGNPITKQFSYEYYETLFDSRYDENDGLKVSISRRDLKDTEKYFKFNFTSYKDNNDIYEAPEYGSIDFSFVSVNNNQLFSFSDYESASGYYEEVYFNDESETIVDITNFSFDKNTGRLIYDYSITYSIVNIPYQDRYDEFTQATVTGHVDVVLNEKKLPQDV